MSIHSVGSSSLTLSSCKFDFKKENDATSVVLKGLKSVAMNGCCFFSDGIKGQQPFHISSDCLIVFDTMNCFNDNLESNFEFAEGQDTKMLNFDCEDCRPLVPSKEAQSAGPDDDQSGGGSGKKLKGGEIAGVVIAALVVIAIIIVLLFVFVIKKTVNNNPDNSDIYQTDQSTQSCESIESSAFSTVDNELVFDNNTEENSF